MCDSPPTPPNPQLEWAVRVLNERGHRRAEDGMSWTVGADFQGKPIAYGHALCFRDDLELLSFEALAIARELEREKEAALPVLAWRDAEDGSGWAPWKIGEFSGVIALSKHGPNRYCGYLAMQNGTDKMLVLGESGGVDSEGVRHDLLTRLSFLRRALGEENE